MSRRRSSRRKLRFHWRPWASMPVPGTDHLVRENWSKGGLSTTIGTRLVHRTISGEWITDTWNLLYWLPRSLRYFRQLGRFQRRRHRDAPRIHSGHGCLLLVALAAGFGLAHTALWPVGWGMLALVVAGVMRSMRRAVDEEEA